MNFKENLKSLRKNANYTQQKLAELLHVTKTTIANYEQGVKEPKLKTLEELTIILSCSYDDLLK
ncbi:MAG: helix-turn-helix domain-containing protein [Anaeroplasmataceae bacterium]|nr:helix-turn-helix domain-containing protein [Anaeroplasmataceae bacterium]